MPGINAVQLINNLSNTLASVTGAMNTIMQFAESYLVKGGVIQSKLRVLELEDIQTFAINLMKVQLSSEDARKVIVAWMENGAVERVNKAATVAKIAETALGSIRVLFASSSVLDAIKSKFMPSSSSGEEGKN